MSLTTNSKITIAPKDSDQTTPKFDHEKIDDNDFVMAIQLVQSSVLPIALNTALELNLIEIISQAGPNQGLSATEISAQLQTNTNGHPNPSSPSMLDRILRLLASNSIVSCKVRSTKSGGYERAYGLGKLSKFFLPDQNGCNLAPLLGLFLDPVVQASWTKLKDSIVEGGVSFNMVHGVNAWEYQSIDERFNKVFNKAMCNYPTFVVQNMLQKYKGFESIQHLVDVGGGLGHTLQAITSMYPHIIGINFDLPHVISDAESYPGVKHVSGDMFEGVPTGDAILMKWVLQVWSDEHCLKVLKNCYNAVPRDGKLIVVESILTKEPETSDVAKTISQLDVYMMTKNPGGKERTLDEFLTLAIAAGFAGVEVKCQVAHFWVMEFYK